MHDFERAAGHRGERVRLGRQPGQHAGAAFRGFVEQDRQTIVPTRERFRHQLAFFELVDRLDTALERVLQRGHRRRAETSRGRVGPHDEHVTPVLDVRNDTLRWGLVWRGIALAVAGFVRLGDPVAGHRMDHEAEDAFFLAAPPAQVHAPHRRRRPVLHFQYRPIRIRENRAQALELAVLLGELQRGLHFVTLPDALFFVGGNPFGAPRGDVLDPVQRANLLRVAERRVAGDAAVGVTLLPEMTVTADGTNARVLGGEACADRDLVIRGNGQQCARHTILAALVIDQAVGTELSQREKARAAEEILPADLASSRRDVGHERKAREVVTRQKTLTREVAISVEVRVERSAFLQQQLALAKRFVMALLGVAPLALGRGRVVHYLLVDVHLASGRAKQFAPAIERAIERREGSLKRLFCPTLGIPRGTLGGQFTRQHRQHPHASVVRAKLRLRRIEGFVQAVEQREFGGDIHIDQPADAVVEFLTGLGKPDRVKMTLHQFAVGEIERGRIHLAVHHAYRITEEVLIVRTLRCAIGDDERGLSGASGAAAALRVIGGRGRNVAQINRVERADIDAQFHRRRAEQDRQPLKGFACLFQPLMPVLLREAEAGLTLHPIFLLDLRGVFARLEVVETVHRILQQRRDVSVEVAEEGIVVGAAQTLAIRKLP